MQAEAVEVLLMEVGEPWVAPMQLEGRLWVAVVVLLMEQLEECQLAMEVPPMQMEGSLWAAVVGQCMSQAAGPLWAAVVGQCMSQVVMDPEGRLLMWDLAQAFMQIQGVDLGQERPIQVAV
mmetsp:Transcript_8468/g.15980  ORF Transcript_8468/g.15980 Transcript_8468/m.15980 type:complete len:121 (+) Transcript_8468:104-466(+)